jgi:rhamnosyltransferase subunit B
MRPVYEILSQSLGPDSILVAQGQAFGAHLAHEKHGTPFATINLQPVAFRSTHDSPLLPGWIPLSIRPVVYSLIDSLVLDREFTRELNSFRSELGLPRVHRIFGSWVHSPQKSIGLFPGWFAPPQPDWPAQAELAGFVYSKEGQGELDPEISAFLARGEPPVVVTAGTAVRGADRFFEVSVQACIELGRRALLLTRYHDQVPSPLPEGVAAFPYAPFEVVLPRGAALIHHGGIGTVAQALAAGIPQLIRPMTFDQPDNAARVQRLGAGLSIRPDRYTPRTAVRALDTLLHSEDVSAKCRLYSAMIDPGAGLAAACDIIEATASHGMPPESP